MPLNLGIMQGRLVPPINGQLQAFPAERWREEFFAAKTAGLCSIEWIFDDSTNENLNPLTSRNGVKEILEVSEETNVMVKSLCADYFISEPLLKGNKLDQRRRIKKLFWLMDKSVEAGISRIILPFVDSSGVEGEKEIHGLVKLLKETVIQAADRKIELNIETALDPSSVSSIMKSVDHQSLKLNYDSGNSASLGYDIDTEFDEYGAFIGSLHIKDRLLGGRSVPLGTGATDFQKLKRNLKKISCCGDIILQVARGAPGDEIDWACRNRDFVKQCLGIK